MTPHPLVARLFNAGFSIYPQFDQAGQDTGLLFVRHVSHGMEVLSAWAEHYALAATVPDNRDWVQPFAPHLADVVRPRTFTEAVTLFLPEQERFGGNRFAGSLDAPQ